MGQRAGECAALDDPSIPLMESEGIFFAESQK
jgi:hypothetical protein